MNIGAGCHPNKVKVSGPGVAKTGLKAFEPTYFTVDCSEAGQGKMTSFQEIVNPKSDFVRLHSLTIWLGREICILLLL